MTGRSRGAGSALLLAALWLGSRDVAARADESPAPAPVQGNDEESPPDARPAPERPAESTPTNQSTPSTPAADRKETDAQPPLAPDAERPEVDYDGRGEEPTTAGDVALWVPRVVLFPLYLVSEYVIRQPLGALVTAAEKNNWPAILVDFFTFGEGRQAGIIPTGLIDFGLRPSVGLYFFWDDVFFDGNDLRARAAWGGADWQMLRLAERVALGDEARLSLAGGYSSRPDSLFHGIGGSQTQSPGDEATFRKQQLDVGLRFQGDWFRSSYVDALTGIRNVKTDGNIGCCGEPTVAERVAAGTLVSPPGMDDEYTVAEVAAYVALDSRVPRIMSVDVEGSDLVDSPGSGVRFAVRGNLAYSLDSGTYDDPDASTHASWLRYGATLGGFVDVTEMQRVLGLSLIADFAEPLTSDTTIPFTEQVSLGGFRPMQGFLEGRLVDRSSLVTRFDYTWPIWVWLDGTAHYSVGNVFGSQLDGFDIPALRSSFGLGVRTIATQDHAFQMQAALGTEPFEEGFKIDTVRLVLGTTSGF